MCSQRTREKNMKYGNIGFMSLCQLLPCFIWQSYYNFCSFNKVATGDKFNFILECNLRKF